MNGQILSRIILWVVLLALLASIFMGGYYCRYKEEPTPALADESPVPEPESPPLAIPIPIHYYSTSHYEFAEDITIEEARGIIEMARSSHQYFYENPDRIKHTHGVEYEIGWVDKYNKLEKLIIKLSE